MLFFSIAVSLLGEVHLDKLIKLQKWAIRTIPNSHFRANTPPLFNDLNLLTVNDIYKWNLECLCLDSLLMI